MKHVILGTAGHIDHGKTSLVKALTGVDTDRLKDEKERGITTELGFTSFDLPSGIRLGIIDVPGHEKFVKHMVAGVWGIDLVALIVAADEGVMPQTREHLDICQLLGVKRGLIVLTKADLVEPDLLDLVREEVAEAVKATFLNGAPVLPVSSVTGEGLPLLISTLDRLAVEAEERSSEGLFRLPIDRAFVMKGFGTVVTGTMVSGCLSLGEQVEVLPSGLVSRVRTLQVYNQAAERAFSGQRTAVNLQGLETSVIERGDVLVRPGTLSSTRMLDAHLDYLRNARIPLKHRAQLRFHTGTSLTMASVFLLDRDEMAPGEGGFVQIRLDRPVVALPGDRFVIRGSGVIQTSGGGVILDPHPSRHKRHSAQVVQDLQLLREGSAEESVSQHLLRAGAAGLTVDALLDRVSLSVGEMTAVLSRLEEKGELLFADPERRKALHGSVAKRLCDQMLVELKEFHQRFPMKSGLGREELRGRLPAEVDVRLFQHLLAGLIQEGHVVLEKEKLRLASYRIDSADEKGLLARVEKAVLEGDLQPPSPRELSEAWKEKEPEVRQVFEHLAHGGALVRIREGIYYHQSPFARIKGELTDYLRRHGEITTAQFKEMTGASRKYVIPLIEYFDQVKLTLRLGEKRVLRAGSKEAGPNR
jgi:selenocysteine-specific elongation factor